MTKKLVWRLKEQPTTEALKELVASGLLTKDEAREILFSSQDEEDRDNESLKSEIKFLRDLVEKLAKRSEIITTIREVEVPYRRYGWYPCYNTWSSSIGSMSTATMGGTNTMNNSFSSISTF